MSDHYRILGVSSHASQEEIKRAYRQLAKQYHPDLNPGPEAKSRFLAIQAAYHVLIDPRSRRIYDWKQQSPPTVMYPTNRSYSPPTRPVYRPEPEPDYRVGVRVSRIWSLLISVFALVLLLDFAATTWSKWGQVLSMEYTLKGKTTTHLRVRTTYDLFLIPAQGVAKMKRGDQIRVLTTYLFKIPIRVEQKRNAYPFSFSVFHPKSGNKSNPYPWLAALLLCVGACNLVLKLSPTHSFIFAVLGFFVLLGVVVLIFL